MTERGKRITGERAKRSTRMCGIDKCQQVGAVANISKMEQVQHRHSRGWVQANDKVTERTFMEYGKQQAMLMTSAHTEKNKMIKWFVIGIVAVIGILDVLLILGCAKLEKEYQINYEKSDCSLGVCDRIECDCDDSEQQQI